MRFLAILCSLCTLFMIGTVSTAAAFEVPSVSASSSGTLVADAKVDLPDVDVDIDTKSENRAWYKNPLIVGLGVVIVILLVAVVGRGGTTIIDRRQ
jgi:hypothetical protein